MITVAVPDAHVKELIGDVGPDARVIVWDPRDGEVPAEERERVSIVCLAHYAGGRALFARLADCPDLKVVQLPSAGYEHVVPFVPPGVSIANARGVHDSRVAEMAVGLAIASRRGFDQVLRSQAKAAWEPFYDNPGLYDSRALVIGYGAIGAAIGARLRAHEVHVEGVGRSERTAPDGTVVHAVSNLEALLPSFDVVIVVTPFDQSTAGLLGARQLALLPDGALVVNVGRGGVIDTDALLAELEARRLWAALDVVDPEPLPSEHPLWKAPQCIIAPHIGGVESLRNWRYLNLVRAQIEARRKGDDPVNFVMMGAFPA